MKTGKKMAVKEVEMKIPKRSKLSNIHEHNQASSFDKLIAIQREVSLLEQLKHPHIIEYLGTQRVESTLFVFLELASEGSILQFLREFGAMKEQLFIKFSKQILEGLSFLHNQGIIHRDIKPSNMLIDKGGVVKLSDFGCSIQVELQVF